MNTPILLIVYIRPETTIHVINALRKIKAQSVYIYQSIPKSKNCQDFENYNKVSNIIKNIDWNCKLKLKKQNNVDFNTSWKSAIKWFFENEREGIILEDDIVPNKSFFIFCTKLLRRYRHNKKIAQICGSSFINQTNISNENYFFSDLTLILKYGVMECFFHKISALFFFGHLFLLKMSNFKKSKYFSILKNFFVPS